MFAELGCLFWIVVLWNNIEGAEMPVPHSQDSKCRVGGAVGTPVSRKAALTMLVEAHASVLKGPRGSSTP